MKKIIRIHSSPFELAEKIASEIAFLINESAFQNKSFTAALSGGSSPELLYSLLYQKYAVSLPWHYVHFFWGDERCVSPDSPDSNFGMASRTFLSKIKIPSVNIHRIRGEENPENEANRYSHEISLFTEEEDGFPCFDLILLGLGDDGHTASIFPGSRKLFKSDNLCAVTIHPETKQKRITFTGSIINNADNVIFLVTGKKKAPLVEKILKNKNEAQNFPASYVVPVRGKLYWYIDEDAGSLL